jgi:hypothetical protein
VGVIGPEGGPKMVVFERIGYETGGQAAFLDLSKGEELPLGKISRMRRYQVEERRFSVRVTEVAKGIEMFWAGVHSEKISCMIFRISISRAE